MMKVLLIVILFTTSHSWKVLVGNTLSTTSHQTVSKYLAGLLASRGHHVTYMSTNVPKDLHQDVEIKYLPTATQVMNDLPIGNTTFLGKIDLLLKGCERFYNEPAVKEMIITRPSYDLLLTFGLFDMCVLGLTSPLQINSSIIHISAPSLMPNHITLLGLPLYSSSVEIPNILIREGNVKESVVARAGNLVRRTLFGMFYDLLISWYVEPVLYKNIENYKGYKESHRTVKMLAMHAHPHPLIDGPTPFGPGVLNLAGSLCKEYQPSDIKPDVLDFLDSAKDGFIYMSFGSSYDLAFDETERTKWSKVFKDLPYKVLLKQSYKGNDLPDNMKIVSWVAQTSLLQHPNIKLFITHGGYASKIEAMCAGVPTLAVPQFAPDQYYTAERTTRLGLGRHIPELNTTSWETIKKEVIEIITNATYYTKLSMVKRHLLATKLTDDQVMGYMDMAVSGFSLLPGYQPWYQYFYLDIFITPVLAGFIIKYVYRRWAKNNKLQK